MEKIFTIQNHQSYGCRYRAYRGVFTPYMNNEYPYFIDSLVIKGRANIGMVKSNTRELCHIVV